MKNQHKGRSWFTKRMLSFRFAFRGIRYLFKTQPNARIHLIAAAIAITLSFILGITPMEWTMIILAIGFVFSMEMINTALEYFTDLVSPDIHPKAGLVKDLAAGAVLFSAIAAFCVGCIVFLPRLF